MKIVLLSNYFNRHQMPLSDALFSLTDGNYSFISTTEMSEERRKLGYTIENIPDYVRNIEIKDADDFDRNECLKIIDDADVVIAGAAPEILLKKRISEKKLTFRYSERLLKKGKSVIKYLPRRFRFHRKNPKNAPIFLLCTSAYTAADYLSFGLFKNKAYKWGYFPKTIYYADINEILNKKDPAKIFWCGRFVDFKHPSLAVKAAERLRDEGYSFKLYLVGAGPKEKEIKEEIQAKNIENRVFLTGAMSAEKVRHEMESSGIFLFTSDFGEGWGAVLNEAMNSGCAVIASHAAGATPYLVQNGENGLIYESGNDEKLYEKLKYLLLNPKEQKRLGAAAYKTISEEWNAEIAAERFLNLTKRILNGGKNPDIYKNGPCSKAEILKNDWWKE